MRERTRHGFVIAIKINSDDCQPVITLTMPFLRRAINLFKNMSRFTCILLIHRDTDCARAQFFTLERRILHHTRSGRVNGSEKMPLPLLEKTNACTLAYGVDKSRVCPPLPRIPEIRMLFVMLLTLVRNRTIMCDRQVNEESADGKQERQ